MCLFPSPCRGTVPRHSLHYTPTLGQGKRLARIARGPAAALACYSPLAVSHARAAAANSVSADSGTGGAGTGAGAATGTGTVPSPCSCSSRSRVAQLIVNDPLTPQPVPHELSIPISLLSVSRDRASTSWPPRTYAPLE